MGCKVYSRKPSASCSVLFAWSVIDFWPRRLSGAALALHLQKRPRKAVLSPRETFMTQSGSPPQRPGWHHRANVPAAHSEPTANSSPDMESCWPDDPEDASAMYLGAAQRVRDDSGAAIDGGQATSRECARSIQHSCSCAWCSALSLREPSVSPRRRVRAVKRTAGRNAHLAQAKHGPAERENLSPHVSRRQRRGNIDCIADRSL